jgi:2-hydroxychromene-2-carboxylate isomerase
MPPTVSSTPAAFYFDLASPLAYLAAERVLHTLPGAAEWRPVSAAQLPGGAMPAFRCPEDELAFRDGVERCARSLGLQPVRWPARVPFDSAMAMRVATYARSIGRTVPFAQAAFRQAYAGGRSLDDEDSVLIAAAACEMHPAAVLKAAGMRSVARELERETAAALAAGVRGVPALVVDGRVHQGEDAVDSAAAQMGAAHAATLEGGAPVARG